jgi:RNA-directed DNA polymerase
LELHPDKTKIVYCKDDNRRKTYPETKFVFLGYEFRCREVRNTKNDEVFRSFTPAVSKTAVKLMRAKIRNSNIRKRTDLSLDDIAKEYNPILRGWLNYYGKYNRSSMYSVLRHFNKTLVTWAMRKFKKLKGRRIRAGNFLIEIAKRQPLLFEHWKIGMIGSFV